MHNCSRAALVQVFLYLSTSYIGWYGILHKWIAQLAHKCAQVGVLLSLHKCRAQVSPYPLGRGPHSCARHADEFRRQLCSSSGFENVTGLATAGTIHG